MSKVTRFPTKAVANHINYPKRVTIDEAKGTRITGDVTFTNLLDLCLGAVVSNAFHVVELTVLDHANALDEQEGVNDLPNREAKVEAMRKAVTEHLFDQMNAAFTKALTTFAPQIAQHPGLTELAIAKAEDEIITAYLEGLPESEREAATQAAQELMAQSKRKLLDLIAAQAQADAAFEFVPLTEDQNKAAEIFRRYEENEESVTEEELDWAHHVEFPMPLDSTILNLAPPEPALTPEQEGAIKILADETATKEEQNMAKAYLEANPLPCMIPAVEPGEVPTFSVTPTKEELDAVGEICPDCGACEPVTPAAKILSGLE